MIKRILMSDTLDNTLGLLIFLHIIGFVVLEVLVIIDWLLT